MSKDILNCYSMDLDCSSSTSEGWWETDCWSVETTVLCQDKKCWCGCSILLQLCSLAFLTQFLQKSVGGDWRSYPGLSEYLTLRRLSSSANCSKSPPNNFLKLLILITIFFIQFSISTKFWWRDDLSDTIHCEGCSVTDASIWIFFVFNLSQPPPSPELRKLWSPRQRPSSRLRLSLLHINYHHFSDKFRLFQSQSSDEKPSEFVCFPPDARNKRILIVEGEFPQKSFLSFFTTFAPLCSSQVLKTQNKG